VRVAIRRRGPERYPDGVLTVPCVNRDAVEWPVFSRYLITLIGGQHSKPGKHRWNCIPRVGAYGFAFGVVLIAPRFRLRSFVEKAR
jgi:hypothetical protein